MVVQLHIDVSLETIRELMRLDRPDLPSCVAIDQARQMYPWVDRLFEALLTKTDPLSSTHLMPSDKNVELIVDVSLETIRELMRLDRPDLPSCVAIDQARQIYPWVNEFFKELCSKAATFMSKYHVRVLYHSLFHDNVDEIFEQASVGVFLKASES